VLDTRIATGRLVLTEPNAIGASLGLLGDEWTLLIARAAFEGAQRYGDWKTQLGISDAVLSARLRTLQQADLLQRVPARDGTGRDRYVLSQSGRDLWPILLTIWAWEQHHVPGQSARLPTMVHTSCGQPFRPTLRCRHCDDAVSHDDIDARFGPSGGFARSAPVGRNRQRSLSNVVASDRHRSPGLFPETIAIIGNRWSSAMVGAAFLGARRFRDFEQIGAPPALVAQRLRALVDLEVFEQVQATVDEPAGYRLSHKGAALFPIVVSFLTWGERWRPASDGPAVIATHRTCGALFLPSLTCSECAQQLRLDTILIEAGQQSTVRAAATTV
jgi:DNA-binding HxlR family transcriptional regulator